MAIARQTALIHLRTGDRPQYGSPYPDGLAVAHIDAVGDATGGLVTFAFFADGGFLYRLESMSWRTGSFSGQIGFITTSHNWLQQKSGAPIGSWDLSYPVVGFGIVITGVAFSTYHPILGGPTGDAVDAMEVIRRTPIGRIDRSLSQQVVNAGMTNVNLLTYDINLVFTYWRKEAIYLPGFLSSFYNAPAVPPLLRAE